MWAPSQNRWKEIIGVLKWFSDFFHSQPRSDHQSDSILASFSTSIVSKYSSTPLARLVHSLRSSSSYMLKSINIFWKLEIIIWWEWNRKKNEGREKSISNRKAAFVSPLFLMLCVGIVRNHQRHSVESLGARSYRSEHFNYLLLLRSFCWGLCGAPKRKRLMFSVKSPSSRWFCAVRFPLNSTCFSH